MLPLGLVFVHLRRRAGGARPQTERDFGAMQTAWGSGSPTDYVVAADCTPADSLPRPPGLPSVSTTVPDSNTHPGIDRGNSLHKAVLPRTTGINVERLDLLLPQPLLHRVGNELGSIVRAQMRSRSLFRNRLR